jgi:signal transduction histidine kinase
LVVYGTRPWLGWALIAFLTLVAVRPWQPYPAVVAIGLLSTAGPTIIGLYAAARRRLFSAMAERAERAEREQHLLAAQARADERARLAGEMHDVVTHRVSLMVLQAGALRVTAPDEPTRRAAEDLRRAGCLALDELRDLLGVLRTGPARGPAAEPRDEPVSLPDLSSLIAESASAGVPVELVETGNPLPTSAAVGRTAYRIAQEALTNVRKHAPGASVRLHVRYDADRIRLTVRNTAPTGGSDAQLAASGSGGGLLGLRQRVELVSGTLDAGPLPGGGFHLDATLPAYVPSKVRP